MKLSSLIRHATEPLITMCTNDNDSKQWSALNQVRSDRQ